MQCFSSQFCQDLKVSKIICSGDGSIWHLHLESPGWSWSPGQFVMLRPLSWENEPFLARPFSIADLNSDELYILFQTSGKGTRALSELNPGDRVTVWGPLGNGFKVQEQMPTLLLAGGIGLAPFIGLIRKHKYPENLELLFGHRQDAANFPFAEISKRILAWNHQDNSLEQLQVFIRALEVKIDAYAPDGLIFACGPSLFLKKVQEISTELDTRTYISLENNMACGVGACLGCVSQSVNGHYLCTCTQGPVFRADEVVL